LKQNFGIRKPGNKHSIKNNKFLFLFSGFDSQEVIVKLLSEANDAVGPVGMDISSGEVINPCDLGLFDNYNVKRQMIHSCTVIACNLLLVDEIMRAGMSSLKAGQ
jgi:T-complex protein 1 subunit zeta